jgi:hypothetical protein
MISAVGFPQINILLDESLLYVHIQRQMPELPEDTIDLTVPNSIRLEELFHATLSKKDHVVDEDNVGASLDDTGILTLDILFKAKKI